jgi:hypothetical protein
MKIGYAYLLDRLDTGAFVLPVEARVAPVQRIMPAATRATGAVLQVPASVAPEKDAQPIDHLLFALKHEGVELQQALLALKKIERSQLERVISVAPNSEYVRRAAYLWEMANPHAPVLNSLVSPTVPYQPLFDPRDHITRANTRRDSNTTKWRIDFNGLGTRAYCPTVRRHDKLVSLLEYNIVEKAKAFTASLNQQSLDRILSWAYLSETRGSDHLEREPTSHDKARRFAQLLASAAEPKTMSEEYLAEIQRAALTNPMLHEYGYRAGQNWLSSGATGASGITYVPPPPLLCMQLMNEIEAIANRADEQANPLVMAALVSFATVLAHPFMDGNGRVHRFIFHAQACWRSGMERGLILPISSAIGRHEAQYLQALESFSKPSRQFWDVMRPEIDIAYCEFKGDEIIYRYWDATECVTFGLEMAQTALDVDLLAEAQYLERHDLAAKALGKELDFAAPDLNLIVREVLTKGELSKNRIKQLGARGYQVQDIQKAADIVQWCRREESNPRPSHYE